MADRRPNILFLFPDQWRGDWMDTNEALPLRLPHLAALAARGTRFPRTLSPSPVCAPCRAVIASGRDYERCHVPSNQYDYPLDVPSLYRSLRDSGYHTMGCGKFDLAKNTLDWHLDGSRCVEEWGFSAGIDNEGKYDGIISGSETPKGPYMQYLEEQGLRQAHIDDFARRDTHVSVHPTTLPPEAYCDNWLTHNGLQLLKEAPADRPWFLQVNFTGPHNPWDITREMKSLYADADFPQPYAATQHSPAEHLEVRRNYAAMCENIDRRIGDLLAEVERRGELDNTLVVFSSDHGEMLGDHDRFGKSVPLLASVEVPLIVAGPGVRPCVTCELPMSILDLTATFVDYGECAAGMGEMDARSLRPVLEGAAEQHREAVYSALHGWRLVFDGRYRLIEKWQDQRWLFDTLANPAETENLIDSDDAEVAAARRRLQKALDARRS